MLRTLDNLNEAINDLTNQNINMRLNESLSRHTTLKVGGPVDVLLYPMNKKELSCIVRIMGEHGLPWRVIGRGSNLLVRDGGIRGVGIKLDQGFTDLEVNGTQVIVGGGYSTVLLATMMTKNGLKGLEFAGGIPGNIGGAVFMNAGAHGSEIAEVLVSAEILLNNGKIITLSKDDLQFRYRSSILQNGLSGIVTKATFGLSEGEKTDISSKFAQFKNQRKNTQPLQFPCAGSVFRNPPQDYAGRLIQEAGLKGYRIGDAEVSTLHGNFIINRGSATAKDVLSLIDHIIRIVDKKFNVKLKPEVLVVGEE